MEPCALEGVARRVLVLIEEPPSVGGQQLNGEPTDRVRHVRDTVQCVAEKGVVRGLDGGEPLVVRGGGAPGQGLVGELGQRELPTPSWAANAELTFSAQSSP